MTNLRPLLRPAATAVALLAIVALALVPGCARKPAPPAWNNPFDPAGEGDSFNVRAVISGNSVFVFWDAPAFDDIAAYEVWRSLDNVGFDLAGETTGATQYADTGYSPGRANYYVVRARNAAGEVSGTSRVVAARADAPPVLEIAAGAARIGTRHAILTLRTDLGDTLEVAATRDFAASQRFAVTPGDTTFVAWDLGPATANGQRRHVWARARSGAFLSAAGHDSVETNYVPDLRVSGQPATVVSRTLDLAIAAAAGTVQMRFAGSRAGLDAATPVAPDSLVGSVAWYRGLLLTADPAPQWLFGRFDSDFGYAVVDSLLCTPHDLAGYAGFELAGGADVTPVSVVELTCPRGPTEMRFAESPDLSDVHWRPWAAASACTLSAGPGRKVVYGQFRNDWFSAVASDSITLVGMARGRR